MRSLAAQVCFCGAGNAGNAPRLTHEARCTDVDFHLPL